MFAKEVIISAGSVGRLLLWKCLSNFFVHRSLKTPQILELSGIGNRSILEPLGIETKIHLPGVGENLQEHFWSQVIFGLFYARNMNNCVFMSIIIEINAESNIQTIDDLGTEASAEEQMKLL